MLVYHSGFSGHNRMDILFIINIIIITLEGTIQHILQSAHCVANCLQYVLSSGQGARVCKSQTTNRVLIVCNMLYAKWYEVTAQLLSFDRIEIASILLYFICLNH